MFLLQMHTFHASKSTHLKITKVPKGLWQFS